MAQEGFKRKLTAILSADVVGYSRLMEENEEATIQTLNTYLKSMANLIQKHRGRVVDTSGDNLMAEFNSAVDSVNCAVEIQKDLAESNAKLPIEQRMQFRIGVNVGDVVEEDDKIYGDGVNIAARVESLSESGGICISGAVYEHVANKLRLDYEDLGKHQVKNISLPIQVYRIMLFPGDAKLANTASVEQMAFPLPDKPSIVVLPFSNMSGAPEQDYLADGLTENLIMSLSKIPEIFVIARNTTFAYKGKSIKAQQVSEELGVRFILEGSVQIDQGNIRINSQLVDAIKGRPVWSEQYNRKLEKLFDLQDDITHNIMVALQVQLTEGEQAVLRYRSTDNFKAWSYAVRAQSLTELYNKEDNAKAIQLIGKAIELDPSYAWAWTWLATTHWIAGRFGFSDSREESFKLAVEIAQKAMSLNDSDPDLHALMAQIYLVQRQYDKAVAAGEKAITLGPNNAEAHSLYAQVQMYNGEFEHAVQLGQSAIRLSPYYPAWYLVMLGHSLRTLERYDEAQDIFKELLCRGQKGDCPLWWGYFGLAETYSDIGMVSEARAQAAKLLEAYPDISIEALKKMVFYKDPEHLERRVRSWERAGIPD